jgi:diadenosine tetraphosphate (Ap4A) HIT family hydrolase
MSDFVLHPRLEADCEVLEALEEYHLLLAKASQVPWLILVPHTAELELHALTERQQLSWLKRINQVSAFVQAHFKADKLNLASIGNLVPQMHWHIIGRYRDDFCFPNVVWGQPQTQNYSAQDVALIRQAWLAYRS